MFLCSSQRATLPSWDDVNSLKEWRTTVPRGNVCLGLPCKSECVLQDFSCTQPVPSHLQPFSELREQGWSKQSLAWFILRTWYSSIDSGHQTDHLCIIVAFGWYAYNHMKIHASDSKLCISWTPFVNKLLNFYKN